MKKSLNKSDFVRSFKPGTPAKDIVAAAKKKRMKLTERYVYVIRSNDNTRTKNGGKGRIRKTNGHTNEAGLRTAIAELGLTRARQVFAEVERAFA